MEKKSASGSIPALLLPLPCYCKQGDCVCPIICYIEEAFSSDILLWACCPAGTGAGFTFNAEKQEATLPARGLVPTNAISSFFIDDQGLNLNAFNYFSKKQQIRAGSSIFKSCSAPLKLHIDNSVILSSLNSGVVSNKPPLLTS